MSGGSKVAVTGRREYPRAVRFWLHLFLLLSVALLPLTSLAARAGGAADLTSNAAVELEQGPLPSSADGTTPAQHRHSTQWAAEAGQWAALSRRLSMNLPFTRCGSDAIGAKLRAPQAPTPPPKA